MTIGMRFDVTIKGTCFVTLKLQRCGIYVSYARTRTHLAYKARTYIISQSFRVTVYLFRFFYSNCKIEHKTNLYALNKNAMFIFIVMPFLVVYNIIKLSKQIKVWMSVICCNVSISNNEKKATKNTYTWWKLKEKELKENEIKNKIYRDLKFQSKCVFRKNRLIQRNKNDKSFYSPKFIFLQRTTI